MPVFSISANSNGSGLLRTSLKCSFNRALTSPSFVRSLPSLSVMLSTCLYLSLHMVLVMSYTTFTFPLFAAVSASHASLSSQSLLSFLILRFTFLSFSLYSSLYFFLTLSDLAHSIFAFMVLLSSTSIQLLLLIHSWFFFFLGPNVLAAVSLYAALKLFHMSSISDFS